MESEDVVFSPTADLLRCVVYNDRVYWETGVTINNSYLNNIKGDKIGKTNYVDVTDVDDLNVVKMENLSTNIPDEPEIYCVKGYDSKYRIMCVIKNKIYLFECFCGFSVQKGEDLMSKINLKSSNISSATYEVNNVAKDVEDLDILKSVIDDLNKAECIEKDDESLEGESISMEIELNDYTKSSINIYKNGYVTIGNFEGMFYIKNIDKLFEILR
jgi:hypothetical protein